MDFDYMLTRVGEFGKYQKILFLFQAPFAIFVTFVLFGQIFMIIYPNVYWCGALGFNDCHSLTELQRSRITSPVDDTCNRYQVSRADLDQFISQISRSCNGSLDCIRLRASNGRLARQSRYKTRWDVTPPSTVERNRAPSGGSPSGSQYGMYSPSGGHDYWANRPTSGSSVGLPRDTFLSQPGSSAAIRDPGAFDDDGFLNCTSDSGRSIALSMNPEITLNTSTFRWSRGLVPCGRRWSHNTSEFDFVTIVTESGYWCDTLVGLSLEWKVTIAQSVFYIGAIVGGILIGFVADNFGRVPALVLANICGCVGGVLSVVTTNFWAFCIFRFIAGLSFDNCFTMIYILVLEYVGPSYRTIVANLSIALFYTFGSVMIPFLFLLTKNWVWFGLIMSLPLLLALGAWYIVPESARWLLSKGKIKDATDILRQFAKTNGNKVEEEVFVEFQKVAEEAYQELKAEQHITLLDGLRRPRIFKNFILLLFIWSLIALIYDGHSRNVLNLAPDFFYMFAIASSLELPADLLLVFTLDVIGRRWLAFASLFFAAAFSLISAVPAIASDGTVLLMFALLSRFFVNIAFNIGLQYAAEVLPTVIRAQGVNYIHIMGYVFSIVSPFIASVGRTNPSLSLTILGFCAMVAAVLCLFLPETLGEDLPNTLDDGESFGSNQSFWTCPVCAKVPKGEGEEKTPIAPDDGKVRLRNSLRASLRGEALRSSIILGRQRPGLKRPSIMESVKLRRVYTR